MEERKSYKGLVGGRESALSAEPRCAHFGECGGCSFQHVPYETQAAWKEEALSDLFGRPVPLERSPVQYGYRTRMDYVTAFGSIGLRPRGRHDRVIDIGHCHLIPEEANAVLRDVRRLKEGSGLRDYDYLRHRGFLRYAVLRQTVSGETMLIFVTKRPGEEDGRLLEEIAGNIASEGMCTSVWWIVHDGLSDLSYGECLRHWGQEFITERIGGIRCLIGPNTFFQSNTRVAEACFDEIRAGIAGGDVLDLYCGAGAISLYIAGAAGSITGVESNPESIRLASRNAELNGVDGVRFVASDVRQFLIESGSSWDAVVLDPPRSGAGKKVMKRVAGLGAQRIIYMSCNPDTFREDAGFLEGYEMTAIRGFDMFPHTPHAELVARFDAR